MHAHALNFSLAVLSYIGKGALISNTTTYQQWEILILIAQFKTAQNDVNYN